jgi:hypothetical protein
LHRPFGWSPTRKARIDLAGHVRHKSPGNLNALSKYPRAPQNTKPAKNDAGMSDASAEARRVRTTTTQKACDSLQRQGRQMIKIPQPAMVLNAPDMVSRYTMEATYDVPPTEHIDVFLRQVRQKAMRQPDKFFKYLIINCHGIYNGSGKSATGGYGLKMGRGIRRLNVHQFHLLREGDPNSRPLVGHILITSCGAAAISPLNSQGDGNGAALCKKMAKYSGAYVSAGNIIQVSWKGQETPYHISGWEGLRQTFAPDGTLASQEWNSLWPLQALIHGPN